MQIFDNDIFCIDRDFPAENDTRVLIRTTTLQKHQVCVPNDRIVLTEEHQR